MDQRFASRVTIVVFAVAAAVAGAVVLVKAQAIALAFFAAIVLGEGARPLVDLLAARIARGAAIAVVFAAVAAAFAFAWWFPLQALAPEFVALWNTLTALPGAAVLSHVPTPGDGELRSLAAALWQANTTITGALAMVSLVLLMAVFWLGSSEVLRGFLVPLISPNRRDAFDTLCAHMGSRLGAYVVGTLVNGTIVAAASTLSLWVLHAPYPVALGLLQGLLVAIPYLGTAIGVVTAGAVVLAAQGPLAALEAIAVLAIVASVEGSFVAPLVFKRSMSVDPLSTTLAVAVGGTLFGVAGIILAVPAACVLQTLVVDALAPAIRSRSA